MDWDDSYLKFISDSYTKEILKDKKWTLYLGTTLDIAQFHRPEAKVTVKTTVEGSDITLVVTSENTQIKRHSKTGTLYKTVFQSSFTYVFNRKEGEVAPDYDTMHAFMECFLLITEDEYQKKSQRLLNESGIKGLTMYGR